MHSDIIITMNAGANFNMNIDNNKKSYSRSVVKTCLPRDQRSNNARRNQVLKKIFVIIKQ